MMELEAMRELRMDDNFDFIEDAELRFELMNIWISEEYGKKRTAVRDLLRTYNREDVWQVLARKKER